MFTGTYAQNFDSKGRVSVPAPFRGALKDGATSVKEPIPGIRATLRPHQKPRAIEGWTQDRFANLIANLDRLDPTSGEYQDLAVSLFADAYSVDSDREGRIIIPDALLAETGLSREGTVVFLGSGTGFVLCDPAIAPEIKAEAKARDDARRARMRGAA